MATASGRFTPGSLANAQGYPGGGGDGSGNGDTFVTTVGYEKAPGAVEKVGNSLKGLLIGPVFIFFGCLLLWYNEGWAIKTHRSLNEALEAYVSIHNADAPPTNEFRNQLVHLTHMLRVDAPVSDPGFDLSRQAVSLNRNVEIYQWVESITKKKIKRANGQQEVQEVVNYKKQWVKDPVGSHNFRHPSGHENTGELPMPSKSFHAAQVNMGAYTLGNVLTNQLRNSNEVPASEAKQWPKGAQMAGNAIYLPRGGSQSAASLPSGGSALPIEEKTMKIDGEEKVVYVVRATGDSYSSREKAEEAVKTVVPSQQQERAMRTTEETEIGDVRISFSEVPCALVSVLAKLSGNILTNWPSRQGAGYDVAVLNYGAMSAPDMVASAQTANAFKTWCFRVGGWFLNFVGFSMITSILSTTAEITLNWIPLLGPMANSLINLGVTIANLILANCTTLMVASIAWVFYRPVLGISLLVGSLGLFVTASHLGKSREAVKKL